MADVKRDFLTVWAAPSRKTISSEIQNVNNYSHQAAKLPNTVEAHKVNRTVKKVGCEMLIFTTEREAV